MVEVETGKGKLLTIITQETKLVPWIDLEWNLL